MVVSAYKQLRKQAKVKAEKEGYTHLNAEFQRIARRDKKAFLNEQCKEIEQNNQNGKVQRSHQGNWKYQGNISWKDGHNKVQKHKDLTEAGDTKKRW